LISEIITKLQASVNERVHKNKANWRRIRKGKIVGETPVVHLENYSNHFHIPLFAKMEGYNPTRSAKDRVALYMIEQAEQNGLIKKGATIIEATSGNTGAAIAHICQKKGYKCVLTIKDKVSKDKIIALKEAGADVRICPGSAPMGAPDNYMTLANHLADTLENAYYLNQNFNQDNSLGHYYTTGPEIWKQTEGKITHYIAAVGTGGTMSGTARYLKEQNPNIKVYGVDAYGSILTKYWETRKVDMNVSASYNMDGVGKKFIPSNIDFDLIDAFFQVEDYRSAHRAREIKMIEGFHVGHSSGAVLESVVQHKVLFKPDDLIVMLFPDHGMKYQQSIYSDEWMKEKGFFRIDDRY
jgi:cystathionine beta-synthase